MRLFIIKFIPIFILIFTFPINSTIADGVTLEQAKEFNLKEGKTNLAALDVFFKLREIYGQRLRTTGGLLFCKKSDLASEIQPSIFELMMQALDILDGMDLNEYGITKATNKLKLALARRAVTATSAYVYSANEYAQSIVKMIPEHKATFCKTTLTSYNQIISNVK